MGWAKKKGKKQENRLYLTRVAPLPLDKWLPVFEIPMLAGTKLWNSCVWESREARKNGTKYPTESEMKEKFKGYESWKRLHSQSSQSVVEEYFEAVRSYVKHKDNGRDEMCPPGFKPKATLRTITWKRQGFECREGLLTLKLSRKLDDIGVSLPEGFDTLELPDGTVLKGTPVEVKVKAVYRKGKVVGLEMHVTWDFGVVPMVLAGKVSAYDLNAALVARGSTEGSQQLLVCRELLSLIQYRNKVIAEFQQKMSRCKEGSRRWKALLSAKRKALKKLERRIDQLTNALTKLMAGLDQAEDITFSVLGDLTDIRRKSRSGDKDKKASQKINQLPYAQIEQQHAYKSLLRQVYPDKASERYSSQTCSHCGTRNKSYRVHRGLWCCKKCRATMHADLNGVNGIMKNYLFGHCGIEQPFPLKPLEVYRWNKRLNRFVKVSPRASA
ncbi:transposase, IS605 OrfB [Candidatus Desulforudis audaxviator MP104C]|uniref:Transposase, IS605 OrfB n=1 Tax=Desulforudis audaxviator (strain MP104C) TaxID=477974 RepID=B1I513_DESAP|nr:RNA-guided endonuclease TnpB family protein [Candidatus Desulforudis audaxviator]ACA60084.1 transposase, IS605 OrfB [Candidatus Desulforudis audaxviator MP104C]